jgi:hypothetical protein
MSSLSITPNKAPAWLVWGPVALMLVGLGVFALRMQERELAFCQRTFSELADGRQSAQQRIAWDRLQALDRNVAQEYLALPSEQDRARYRAAFIESFAKGFQHVEAKMDMFKNWRVFGRDQQQVIIAVDHAPKRRTLLFRVSRRAPMRLEGIQWL